MEILDNLMEKQPGTTQGLIQYREESLSARSRLIVTWVILFQYCADVKGLTFGKTERNTVKHRNRNIRPLLNLITIHYYVTIDTMSSKGAAGPHDIPPIFHRPLRKENTGIRPEEGRRLKIGLAESASQ